MRIVLSQLLFILVNSSSIAQWTGEYLGTLSGDKIHLKLTQTGHKITGTLTDSQQSFDVFGEIEGNRFAGEANEERLGLNITLLIEKKDQSLNCILAFEYLGEITETPFTLTKIDSSANLTSELSDKTISSNIPFPSQAAFPSSIIGRWTKNESYNSGYGDNFMGANFSQSMSLNADGTVSEGGSSASMSGSFYSGQTNSYGEKKVEGLGWYTMNNQLYLFVFHEGKWQSVLLGRWYVEANNMLITGINGEKLLLSR